MITQEEFDNKASVESEFEEYVGQLADAVVLKSVS